MTYTRLSRTTGEDERDGSAFAVLDVVPGAAAAGATEAAELALVDDRRGKDDGGCVEQVGEGGGVLHFGKLDCWS